MFTERKIICFYLILFLILPFISQKKEKNLIIPWTICSCLLFIFPFLPDELNDSLPSM